ncbi:NAD(P)-dependent oxidoreductase [Streptomyces sp. WAC07061]|uniref:NAD(P)-dependent oxidoreductase n=1 Tax=Streptomyces sp. WAC07061 TaxID=2487410 RepID=UPI000F773CF0|nr:NAD(P)-dependent oxidoreductase [Streptomyces sp. WAC07061]RSS49454.1 NAD(P)-dependent oxidoreductase [Streptomyces sp. WAC07061]
MTTLTLLNPGAMGAAVAAQAVKAGHEVLWVPEGRSDATHRRAKEVGATACDSLDEALERSEIALSICPPQAAEDVATTVAGQAFAGVYVDANAINPQRMQRIAEEIRPGAMVLDGAIFGPPPGGRRAARLYLAGEAQAVDTVQPVFKDTALHVRRASGGIGSASALKMAFASYQKAARTLAGVAHALADAHGVGDELTAEAQVMASNILSDPGYLPSVAARAWRWAPEMEDIAETLRAAGLPADMADAAVAVMACWEGDKDRYDLSVAEVLSHLQEQPAR